MLRRCKLRSAPRLVSSFGPKEAAGCSYVSVSVRCLFHQRFKGQWNEANLLVALQNAEQSLGIRQPEDWYSVTLTDLRELGLPARLSRRQLSRLLMTLYPSHNWNTASMLRCQYAQQRRLEKAVISLFPGEAILWNATKEAGLLNEETGYFLELDIYLPGLNLAFEYQDVHHYSGTGYAYKELGFYQARDLKKQQLAEQRGITIIPVPFWWDDTIESLVATIKSKRPDLLPQHASSGVQPISTQMPSDAQGQRPDASVEGVGQPITATFLTKTNVDPTNWWLFEKYDGVRAFWNPTAKAFYSRGGNTFQIPQEITDTMPSDIFLDGELWFGRDSFKEAMKVSNRAEASSIAWDKLKYMVFDIPDRDIPFHQRYSMLEEKLGELGHRYIEVAPKVVCTDSEHLESFMQDILDGGGEGIILRNPEALYQSGRSRGFLKHKKFRDAEARVVSLVGPHQWECELPSGIRFIAVGGTSEFLKRWTPKVGDVVSFKHHGFLFGTKKPKLPTLYRIRSDLHWADVVNSWKETKPQTPISVGKKLTRKATRKQRGHWRETKNLRQFFINNFAKPKGFDPDDVAKWATITTADMMQREGGATILTTYGSVAKALWKAFPDLFQEPPDLRRIQDQMVKPDLPSVSEDYISITLNDVTELASKSEISLEQVLKEKYPSAQPWDLPSSASWWIFEKYDGVRGIWNPHQKAMYTRKGKKILLPQHIIDALPSDAFLDGELWFGRNNFREAFRLTGESEEAAATNWQAFKYTVFDIPTHTGTYQERYDVLGEVVKTVNQPFIELATKEEYKDSQQMQQLYSDIIARGGEGIILRNANHRHKPGEEASEVASRLKVRAKSKGYWLDRENRRQYFTRFADAAGFDVNDLERWRKISIAQITDKMGLGPLPKYKFSLGAALADTFLDMKSDIQASPLRPREVWGKDITKCREFFDELAAELGITAPDPAALLSIPVSTIKAKVGGQGIIRQHGGVKKALTKAYPELVFQKSQRAVSV